MCGLSLLFCYKEKTEYDVRISDWSSVVCSSDRLSRDTAQGVAFVGCHVDTVHCWRVRIDVVRVAAELTDLHQRAVERQRVEAVRGILFAGSLPVCTHHDTLWGAENFQAVVGSARSEEHTSELQSLMRISYAVFCLKK